MDRNQVQGRPGRPWCTGLGGIVIRPVGRPNRPANARDGTDGTGRNGRDGSHGIRPDSMGFRTEVQLAAPMYRIRWPGGSGTRRPNPAEAGSGGYPTLPGSALCADRLGRNRASPAQRAGEVAILHYPGSDGTGRDGRDGRTDRRDGRDGTGGSRKHLVTGLRPYGPYYQYNTLLRAYGPTGLVTSIITLIWLYGPTGLVTSILT